MGTKIQKYTPFKTYIIWIERFFNRVISSLSLSNNQKCFFQFFDTSLQFLNYFLLGVTTHKMLKTETSISEAFFWLLKYNLPEEVKNYQKWKSPKNNLFHIQFVIFGKFSSIFVVYKIHWMKRQAKQLSSRFDFQLRKLVVVFRKGPKCPQKPTFL